MRHFSAATQLRRQILQVAAEEDVLSLLDPQASEPAGCTAFADPWSCLGALGMKGIFVGRYADNSQIIDAH